MMSVSNQSSCATWGAVRTQHHFHASPATDAHLEPNHGGTSGSPYSYILKNWSVIFKKVVNGKEKLRNY